MLFGFIWVSLLFDWSGVCCCSVIMLSLTLCNPMDYSPPSSSVHGFSQAKILEWVAISFSRGSSWCRDQTHIFYIDRRLFNTEPLGNPLIDHNLLHFEYLICLMYIYCVKNLWYLRRLLYVYGLWMLNDSWSSHPSMSMFSAQKMYLLYHV